MKYSKEDEGKGDFMEDTQLILFVGKIAVLFGLVNYIRVTYIPHIPPYSTYMVGGIVLILVAWLKMKFFRK